MKKKSKNVHSRLHPHPMARGLGTLCALLVANHPTVHAEVPSSDMPVLVVPDGTHMVISFLRTDTRDVFYELVMPELLPECRMTQGGCVLTEVEHVVHGGHDYLDFNLSLSDASGTLVQPGSVKRYRLAEEPELIFSLEQLDLSQLPFGAEVCPVDPAAPCSSGEDVGCFLWFPHDLEILYDDPDNQYIEYLITDLATFRIMKVNFDYRDGNTCAVVEWVLEPHNDDFYPYYWPNDADYMVTDAGEYLMVGYYSASKIYGGGKIQLWKRPDPSSEWEEVWTFPESARFQLSYLNTPHAPLLYRDESGGLTLRYAHSRADGDRWGVGYRGSVGYASLSELEAQPIYRFESRIPVDDPAGEMGFTRDVEPTSDGRLLVMDSGCMLPPCQIEGRVYLMPPEQDVTWSNGLSGAWSPDRAQQNFVDLDMSGVEIFSCGFGSTYEADFLTVGDLGQELSAQLEDVVRQCDP